MTAKFDIYNKDCFSLLSELKDNSIDLIVTDYAYESLEKHRKIGTTTRLTSEWFLVLPNCQVPKLMSEFYRVLKPNCHLYMLTDQETMIDVVRPFGKQAGFTWWKSLTWVKTTGTDTKQTINFQASPASTKIGMGYHWRASKEEISFLEKGKRKLNNLGWPDVIHAPRVSGYPTEKPVSLLRTLIENSSQPGDTVLDPFMGSGSTGEAALLSGRNFVGGDLSEKAFTLTKDRLNKLSSEYKI